MPRLVELLQAIGLDISKRQVVRILTEANEAFVTEARDVLRAGLSHAGWISVDDTGARHQGRNGVCTQIGNDAFTFFATTTSKNRANFLGLLRAGHEDYVLNDQAMRRRNLAGTVIATLREHPARHFADAAAWTAHLEVLGISGLTVTPDPVTIATEGALWGAVVAHGFLLGAVIVSDDAGQFNVGTHALCWVHAERLIHKLDAFTDHARKAKERIRALVWWFYADLKAYRDAPDPRRKAALKARFNRIFQQRTGFLQQQLGFLTRHPPPSLQDGQVGIHRSAVTAPPLSRFARLAGDRPMATGTMGLASSAQKASRSDLS